MKTVYKYKGKEINIDNYEEVISKKIAYIFIRLIIYINVLIFGRTIFKIMSSILLIYDIISFITLFIIYYNLYKFKNTKIPQENINFTLENSAKLMGIDLLNDNNDLIKRKYRELSKKWHPDKFINDTIENQDKAKRNFQKLNKAYTIIKQYRGIK